MKNIEKQVIKVYIPYQTTLREVSRIVGIDHHRVKRILKKSGVEIVKGKRAEFTAQHRENISKACKGRSSWCKGKKMPKEFLYKNMAAHIRFDIDNVWLSQFSNIEMLKCLNNCITKRTNRFDVSTCWYKKYITKFYFDSQFIKIYKTWIANGKPKYLKPSIDHISPKAHGGENHLNNIQFLTWFENRCKNDMSQVEWVHIKNNLKDYLL